MNYFPPVGSLSIESEGKVTFTFDLTFTFAKVKLVFDSQNSDFCPNFASHDQYRDRM